MSQATGYTAHGRVRPSSLEDAKDALAIAVGRKMRAERISYAELRKRHGYSKRRCREISLFLRGEDANFGLVGAVDLAERLGFEVDVVIRPRAPSPAHV